MIRLLVDAYAVRLTAEIPEIDTTWNLQKYERPITRGLGDLTFVSIYPLDETLQPISSQYDFRTITLAVEFIQKQTTDPSTLLVDQDDSAAWLTVHERFVEAAYKIRALTVPLAHECRYVGTDFGVITDALARVFRIKIKCEAESPAYL